MNLPPNLPEPASPPAPSGERVAPPVATRTPEHSRTGFGQWFGDPFILLAFATALVLDQTSKAIVVSNLARGESWPVEGFFRFTYARNTGTIFGLFQDQGIVLTVISFSALAGMVYFFRGSALPSRIMRVAFGMMLGGAIGNLADRIRHGFVVDFVDVGPWPIFNLADSSIIVGIAILIWATALREKDHDPAPPSAASDSGTGQAGEGTEDGGRFDSG